MDLIQRQWELVIPKADEILDLYSMPKTDANKIMIVTAIAEGIKIGNKILREIMEEEKANDSGADNNEPTEKRL